MSDKAHEESTFISVAVIFLIGFIIVGYGLFAFFMVGNTAPDWEYRPVLDVPSESPYASYDLLPNQQHVQGREGK